MHENEIGTVIVDCAVYLHKDLGPGLLETVYEVTLARKLEKRGLSVQRQVPIAIEYEGQKFDEGFRADLIVEGCDMNLSEHLRQFDGKHIEPLESLATQLLTRKGSADELIALSNSDEAKTQVAATWILKWLHERHVLFSKSQTQELFRILRNVTHWEAKLHLLQMLHGLDIPPQDVASLHRFLKERLCDNNKLVRAWSYNGLFVLGEQHGRFRKEVAELLNEAKHDTAASVRARVRKICKASSWTNSAEQSADPERD
jgi:hypothetical protein